MNHLSNAFHALPLVVRYLLIALVASLLFFPFLGGVHLFDWDEINFAECAREMIVTKDYIRCQIDFMPFWEKPPVFIWMQVLGMKMFGVGAFAARFPNACMGVVTLVTLFYVGKRLSNDRLAGWWVVLYAASWLPQFYFKTGIIDPTFNYFIFLCFFQLHLLKWDTNKVLHAILAGLFLGIAILTKGPASVVVVVLSGLVYFIFQRGLKGYKPAQLLLVALCACIPFCSWMLVAALQHGIPYAQWFLQEFISYQIRLFTTEDSDHGGPFYYHFVILLFGCFPASVFFFNRAATPSSTSARQANFKQLMQIMFWVVLILFSIVKTKIVHYSSLCYFPLTFLAALQVQMLVQGAPLRKITLRLLLFVGGAIGVLVTALPLVGLNKQLLIPLIADPFAVGNLQANIPWSYAECLWGIGYLGLTIGSIYWMKKNRSQGLHVLLLTQLIGVQVVIFAFTGKIEGYSQRAAIEFFESFKGKDVYVAALGYKSYAYLYYADKQHFAAPEYYNKGRVNEQWLLNGRVDKPVYFISKIQNEQQYLKMPSLQKIGSANGFVFFKRNLGNN